MIKQVPTQWHDCWTTPAYPSFLNEDMWFGTYQTQLVRMANTDFGRDLLCIPQYHGEIVGIKKNVIVSKMGNNKYRWNVHIGAKWANVIRSRWNEFDSYSRYFLNNDPLVSPLVREARATVCATTQFYPDPDPETTTMDARLIILSGVTGSGASGWENYHNAASADSVDDSGVLNVSGSDTAASGSTDGNRAIMLFDTSSVTGSISSAKISIYPIVVNDGGTSQSYHSIVSSNPASNTGVVAGDFMQVGDATDNPTKHSADVDATSMTTSAYNDFTLNGTGITAINTSGVSKYGMRDGHDIEDVNPGVSFTNNTVFRTADQTGILEDPILEIVTVIATTDPTPNFFFVM